MNRCVNCYGDLPDFAVFCPHCANADAPDFQQLLHQTVGGRYKLYRRLGQGGLSTVFAAADLQTDIVVVVKVSDPAQLVQRELSYAIDAEAARNYWGEMLERMRREAETLAEIDHPNIVRFFDTGLIGDDLRFVVMEFLRGRTLRDELDARGRLEPAAAIHIALEICQALREVHARGIVHRDLSPRNIMIADCRLRIADSDLQKRLYENDGLRVVLDESSQSAIRNPQSAIKLIDFGIAKFPQPPGAPPFTQHSVLSGTVAYASPEQCQSREVDARSDVYSLGVMLYEMVTGQKPFSGRTPTEIALKQIQEEPVPPRELCPDLPANLERVILRALAKLPAERQQSAEKFAEELQSSGRIIVPFQALQSAEATDVEDEDEALEQRLRLVRRRRRRVTLAAAALLLVGATTGILLGKDWLASRLVESPLVSLANFGAQPSPSPSASPDATNSDPDALELAAQLPADSATNPNASKPAPPSLAAVAAPATSKASTPLEPTPSPAPVPTAKPAATPAPPPAVVKTSPAPSPTIAVSRTPSVNPPPANKPEVAQAPHKAEDRFDPRSNKTTDENYHNDSPPVARRDRIATTRRNDEDSARRESNARRQEPPNTSANRDADDDPQDREDSQSIGPKLIQWSGSVNREREIIIELPGKPGRLEIPRVYRNRVGMVEPPSPANRWRCAKLRVLGQGGVSFVVRWWPEIVNLSRLGGH